MYFLICCLSYCQCSNIMQNCCILDNEHKALLECVRRRSSVVILDEHTSSYNEFSIKVVSFSSQNMEYHTYSEALHQLHVEKYGYNYSMYDDVSNADKDYEPDDRRWNKVGILSHELNSGLFDYVIWMDADLVIVDMQFNFSDIIAKNPYADILVSGMFMNN